jgi:hypothetical protein
MNSLRKVVFSTVALGLTAIVSRADETPADIANDLANGKSTTGSAYYDGGSEVFPNSNVTNERFDDSGAPYDWSFWLTPNGDTGYVTIDLGADYSVDQFDLQDTHNRGYFDRGTNDFTIATSLNGTDFTTVYTGSFNESEWANLTWQDDTITATDAEYVRFTIDSFYGSSGGLNELQVFGSPAQNEGVPDSGGGLALMVATLGLLLFVGRSKVSIHRDATPASI